MKLFINCKSINIAHAHSSILNIEFLATNQKCTLILVFGKFKAVDDDHKVPFCLLCVKTVNPFFILFCMLIYNVQTNNRLGPHVLEHIYLLGILG